MPERRVSFADFMPACSCSTQGAATTPTSPPSRSARRFLHVGLRVRLLQPGHRPLGAHRGKDPASGAHRHRSGGRRDGSLMAGVRKQVGWMNRRRLRFSLVESSAPLREKQKQRLGDRVTSFEDLAAALDASQGRAIIYHNELLDAPVDLIEWDFDLRAPGFLETPGFGAARCADCGGASRAQVRRRERTASFSVLQGIDIFISAARRPSALRTARPVCAIGWRMWCALKAAPCLSIDYGDQFPAIYHRRPRHAARASVHQRLEGLDVYQNAGRQDITADVAIHRPAPLARRQRLHGVALHDATRVSAPAWYWLWEDARGRSVHF